LILLWVLTKKELLLISIYSKIRNSNGVSDYLMMTSPKGMDELF
jgi:hypothetical protein